MNSFQVSAKDLDWSDEEDCDEKYLVKHNPVAGGDDESLDSFQINEKKENVESSIVGEERLADHRRSKFSGYIEVDKMTRNRVSLNAATASAESRPPYYPDVPSNVRKILGDSLLTKVWDEFISFGADEAEMILVKDVYSIGNQIQSIKEYIGELTLLKGMEKQDYVEFRVLMIELAKLYRPHERLTTSKPTAEFCSACCSMGACSHNLPGGAKLTKQRTKDTIEVTDENEEDEDAPQPAFPFVGSEEHRLGVVFSQVKSELNGKVRIKHIASILEKLFIPFDKKRLPVEFWQNRGELLIGSLEQLQELVAQMRTDLEVVVDPMAEMFKYELPQWLREEFKASEIMLYEHHFSLIDKDGGGSIDVDELQELITAFGSHISREDAQNLLDEYDMDGGGTIDFVEFMVLIYKIQRGTIDLSTSDLAKALVEAKSQLKIFEEIEEVSRDPPPNCSVAHFGGSPVECNFHIQGPPGSPYEGLELTLQMTFQDGYPYLQPDILFRGRVMGLHMLPALGGDARLMHIKQVWSAEWTMRRLLAHTVDILQAPDPELLPGQLFEIYSAWESALVDARKKLPALALQQLQKERAAECKAGDEKAEQQADAMSKPSPRPLSARNQGGQVADCSPAAECKQQLQELHAESKAGSKASTGEGKEEKGGAPSGRDHCDSIPEDAIAQRALQLEHALTMDDLSDQATRKRVLALPRIERMHLATMLVFLLDRDKYHSTVRGIMQQHCKNFSAGSD